MFCSRLCALQEGASPLGAEAVIAGSEARRRAGGGRQDSSPTQGLLGGRGGQAETCVVCCVCLSYPRRRVSSAELVENRESVTYNAAKTGLLLKFDFENLVTPPIAELPKLAKYVEEKEFSIEPFEEF